jgi:hypothetical protein
MKHTATLSSPQQAHAVWSSLWSAIKQELNMGQRLTVSVGPVSKTRDQEEKYHAMIGEIAEQAQHLGASWDAEAWKRFLLDAFAKETGRQRGKVVPNLTGDGVVEVGLQSRRFSKADGIEFIEWLQWWGAEHGVKFKEQA